MYDCLLGMTARTVPDGAWRTEVVDVARWSSSREGRVGRLRELAGVATFGLRLRAVRATAAQPAAAWAQGAALGSVLLLVTALAAQIAATTDAADLSGIVAAAAIATALAAATSGRTAAAALLTALALPPAAANGDPWNPTTAALAVALVALTLATTASRSPAPPPEHATTPPTAPATAQAVMVAGGRRLWVGAAVAVGASVVMGESVAAGGGAAAAQAVAVIATLVVPVGLVVAGGADARLAVAAAVAWSWRFLAIDPTDVLDALAALRSSELPVLLVRLAAMAWGVGVAIVVAHRSARRAAAL